MRFVTMIAVVVLFSVFAHAAGDQRVAVLVTGDKSSQIHDSIVKIVEKAHWKPVDSSSGVQAVIKGELVQKKGHGGHLRLKLHKGADGPVVTSIDVRVGKKATLDARKKKQISKKLTAALGTIKDKPKAEPAAAPPPATAEAKAPLPAASKPTAQKGGKPVSQSVDDEAPPGMK